LVATFSADRGLSARVVSGALLSAPPGGGIHSVTLLRVTDDDSEWLSEAAAGDLDGDGLVDPVIGSGGYTVTNGRVGVLLSSAL
jgi:hypothetical protein